LTDGAPPMAPGRQRRACHQGHRSSLLTPGSIDDWSCRYAPQDTPLNDTHTIRFNVIRCSRGCP
jgi:hypothetical protein